jgi:hypothetical protein
MVTLLLPELEELPPELLLPVLAVVPLPELLLPVLAVVPLPELLLPPVLVPPELLLPVLAVVPLPELLLVPAVVLPPELLEEVELVPLELESLEAPLQPASAAPMIRIPASSAPRPFALNLITFALVVQV